ncbi:DUF6524 family protein [Falsiroseomonas sp.]|uniref:DUF6524 family protein n=1 Tax=Falsiroseomonas sp. TaxID=2870721 RepID=UPI0035695466
MSEQRFDWRGVVARALFSLFIVFAIYNPSGTSFLHWVLGGFGWFWLKLATGALLAAICVVLWRTTVGVLGRRGIVLVALFNLGAGMTLLHLTGASLLAGQTLLLWALIGLAGLFTAGLCYSHLHHRLGGISHTEEVSK